jgi:chemotaxis protein methyltransferase CheR
VGSLKKQQAAMSEVEVNPMLTGHEVRELQLLIEQRSGILFDVSRERFLTTRVVEHMQRKRLSYGLELLRLVRGSNAEYDDMLERLLTQETSFLRYPGLFSAFEQRVLPELLGRKFWDKESALRIWSAGCSSGEEPYSIALTLCDAPGVGSLPPANILATDVSREALERAERGVYSGRALENLSRAQILAYFSQRGEHYAVKPMLRGMVQFAPLNLAHPVYLGRFDCIFCMNVLIYFSAELRCKLIQRFYEALEPGGYLFLGHAESVSDAPVRFHQTFINGARLLQKPLHPPAGPFRAAEVVQ